MNSRYFWCLVLVLVKLLMVVCGSIVLCIGQLLLLRNCSRFSGLVFICCNSLFSLYYSCCMVLMVLGVIGFFGQSLYMKLGGFCLESIWVRVNLLRKNGLCMQVVMLWFFVVFGVVRGIIFILLLVRICCQIFCVGQFGWLEFRQILCLIVLVRVCSGCVLLIILVVVQQLDRFSMVVWYFVGRVLCISRLVLMKVDISSSVCILLSCFQGNLWIMFR